jgi:GNAT superfamily N-acetyltransferase
MPKYEPKWPYEHYSPILTIRASCKSDLATIYKLLCDEEKANVEGNFLCNFRVIINAFMDNEVIVATLDDDSGSRLIGYYAAFENSGGILQVRSTDRSKGVGTYLANAGLKRFRRRGLKSLEIQCAPFTSRSFWQKMGATFENSWSDRGVIDLATWKPARIPSSK